MYVANVVETMNPRSLGYGPCTLCIYIKKKLSLRPLYCFLFLFCFYLSKIIKQIYNNKFFILVIPYYNIQLYSG